MRIVYISHRVRGTLGVAAGVIAVSSVLGACTQAVGETNEGSVDGIDVALLEHVVSITRRGDGTYNVLCEDGTVEVASWEAIVAEEVCNPEPVVEPGDPSDPFHPSSCAGAPLTQEEALRLFEPGTSSIELTDYQLMERARRCNELTGCADWSEPSQSSLAGTMHLYISDGRVHVRLYDPSSSSSSSCTGRTYCGSIDGSEVSCGGYTTASRSSYYGCSYGGWCGGGCSSRANDDIQLAGVITSDCVRLAAEHVRAPGSDGTYWERQYVLYEELEQPVEDDRGY